MFSAGWVIFFGEEGADPEDGVNFFFCGGFLGDDGADADPPAGPLLTVAVVFFNMTTFFFVPVSAFLVGEAEIGVPGLVDTFLVPGVAVVVVAFAGVVAAVAFLIILPGVVAEVLEVCVPVSLLGVGAVVSGDDAEAVITFLVPSPEGVVPCLRTFPGVVLVVVAFAGVT